MPRGAREAGSLVPCAVLWRARGVALLVTIVSGLQPVAHALDSNRSPIEYVYRSWQVRDGLPQATVTGIAQTEDGYLWVSTLGGLARFDGLEFRSVGAGADLPPRIGALHGSSGDELWAAGENGGLWRIHGASGRIDRIAEVDAQVVRAVLRDRDGGVWLATATDGVVHLHDGQVRRIDGSQGLASNYVLALAQTSDGTLWFGTERGLCRLAGGRVRPFSAADGVPAVRVTALLARRDGSLVVGLSTGGVYLVSGERVSSTPDTAGLRGAYVTSLAEDRDGTTWIGSMIGLYRFRGDVVHHVGAADGLTDVKVQSILLDADGSLWAGTNAGGLNLLRDGPFRVYGRRDGLPTEQTLSVTADRDGAALVTLNCGPVMRIAGGVARELAPGTPKLEGCFWAVLRARDGSLWLGTWGGGLVRVAGNRATWVTSRGGLPDDKVVALFQRRSGEIWAGTQGGACRMDGMTPVCLTTRDGLVHNDVRSFAETADGALWIATSGGLSRWHSGRFSNLTTTDGLPSPLTRALHVDEDGFLWVGTYGGGLALVRGGRLDSFANRHGLLDDVVSWIGQDDDGYFWLSGNQGIFRVARFDLLAVADGRSPRVFPMAFGVEDGLKTSECAGGLQPAGARTPDGRFWFPTLQGVASLDPRALPRRAPRRAVIEGVRIDGRAVDRSFAPTLPADLRTLEISYSGLDLAAANKLIFRYRLEGVDSDWVDAGPRRAAYYGTLRPGRYSFAVQAFSPDGGWGPTTGSLLLRVPEVFWRSWWFISAAVLGLAGLLFSLGAWRQSARDRHEREHADIARRLAAGILHEFRQPLQVIRTRVEIQRLRDGTSGGRAPSDDAVKALDRLGGLLDRLERLHTVTALPTRRYSVDETMAALDDEDGRA